MKTIHTFAVALTLGVGSIAGYALLDDPTSIPARPHSAFPDDPTRPGSPGNSNEQAARETPGFAAGASLPAFQHSAAETEFQPASTGMTSESSPGIAPGAIDAKFQPASTRIAAAAKAPPPRIPLAFIPLPPGVAAANPQLAAAVQGLRQEFVNAVGAPNQDPNDPAYYQRWIGAQKSIDEEYHVMVGDDVFLIDQIQVNSNSQPLGNR